MLFIYTTPREGLHPIIKETDPGIIFTMKIPMLDNAWHVGWRSMCATRFVAALKKSCMLIDAVVPKSREIVLID